MWYRRSVIARSFIALLASIMMLSVFFITYLKSRWLGLGVIPLCFIPAVVVAARLAQRVDLQKKEAFWIGLPTILAMTLITLFSFFMHSALGERSLRNGFVAVLAVVALAVAITLLYVFAQRLAGRSARSPR